LRKERLAANRRSAAVSRQRRKILIEELQNSVSSLVKENASLRRDNDKLKEQLEQLREENRNLASYSSDDESDDSDSPAPTSTDEAQQDLSSQTTFENDQSQQLTAAPTNMAGLGVGLANAGGLLLPQVTNPSLTAIGQGHMYGNASLGQLAGIANPLAFSAGSIQQPQLMGFPFNTQMQLQQFNNSQMQQFNTLQLQQLSSMQLQQLNNGQMQQLNNAQINQELLNLLPPHMIRMLMGREMS